METLALPKIQSTAAEGGTHGYFTQAWEHVRSALCALHGHDLVLHFERGRRVCLRCRTCGHETPGWSTK